jgi:hypothetical protein
MESLWPWLAVAGLGALHGASPATGWMFAAAWGVRAGGRAQVRRALWSIGIGHALSIAVVAAAVAQGMAIDPMQAQRLAGAVLLGAASCRLLRGVLRGSGTHAPVAPQAGHAGIALWSFLMATAHGAGLMIVPALVPLCLAGNPAREITASGSMVLALAAVAVHTAAMLATTGVIATRVCRELARHARLARGPALRRGWTVALAATGAILIALP